MCSVVGNVCGKLGIVLTVIGLLGMIFPPIGVAVSGIARILNVVGIICEAVAFALSGVLTGLNGVVLAQQIAAGSSAEEKAATADLMMSEANDAAAGFINMAMIFGPKFMSGMLGSSKGIVGALLRRAKATIGRVSIKASGDLKLFASKIVRKLGFGGAAMERVGGAWKDTGIIARTKGAIGSSRVGQAFNSAPEQLEAMQNKLMARYGNTAVARGLDRVGAWSGSVASKFDLEEKVGDLGTRAGKAVGNAGSETAFGQRMAAAADQSELETRRLAMQVDASDAAHLEQTRWKNYLDKRAKTNPDEIRSDAVDQKFIAKQGARVQADATADFESNEAKAATTARIDEMKKARFERHRDDYFANEQNAFTGKNARDMQMDTLHGSRAKRFELEGEFKAQDAERADLLAKTARTTEDDTKLAALNSQLKPLDEARRLNQVHESDLSAIAAGGEAARHPDYKNWGDVGSNVWSAMQPALELAGLKDGPSAWQSAEKGTLKKQIKYDKGKASGNAASRGGHGTYADIASTAQQAQMADFSSFVRSSARPRSLGSGVRGILAPITSKPVANAPVANAPTPATPAPAPRSPGPGPTAVAPPAVSETMVVTPQVVDGGAVAPGGAGPAAAAGPAPAEPAPAPTVASVAMAAMDEASAEPLPYWPAMMPDFDHAQSDFAWMRKVGVEFKKAQIEGKQKAVDTLAVYGRYQEYAKLRAAAAQAHASATDTTAKSTQQNVDAAGQSEQHGAQGESKQGEARGAANDRAATDLPEPESRGFWGRVLGAVKRWAKDKAAQVFGWIQEKIASVVLKGLCGVSMGDMREYAGALKRQQAAAHGVAQGGAQTAGQAQQTAIKLGADATKEAQSAADAIGECDRNITDVDSFVTDVTSFEQQLAEEKAFAQTFLAQLHAEVQATQAKQKADAAAEAATDARASAAGAAAAAAGGGVAGVAMAAMNATVAAPAPTAAPAPQHEPEPEPVAADGGETAAIHSAASYVGSQSDSLGSQLEARADDYHNQLKLALTNHTGKDASGVDLQGPAKKASKTIVDEFKTVAQHAKTDMDGFASMSIDPSSAHKIADSIIQSADHLEDAFGQSEHALDDLFERTYAGIRDGKRTLKSRMLDGNNMVGAANHAGDAAADNTIDKSLPAMTTAWNDVAAPIQVAPSAPAPVASAAPVQRKADGDAQTGDPAGVAAAGLGSGTKLPHHDRIQASFGSHDISNVRAHTGAGVDASSKTLGARAYATGDDVAFAGGTPDLHTAAHEAAHVVQQRQGVQLKGGIDGGAGDPYEQHADAVADAVVAGKSAEPLLDQVKRGSGSAAVQRDVAAPTTANAMLVTGAVAASVADRMIIVEDSASVDNNQVRKSEFFAKVEPALRAAASDELGMLRSVAACPYITHYLAMYRDRPAADTEALIRKFTGSQARDPQQLQLDLIARARAGIRQWKETGKLPSDLVAADPGAAHAAEVASGSAGSAPRGTVQRKSLGLNDGAPLDSSTQSRMDGAFGTSFADVRVHDDEAGGAAAKNHGAKAFAAGNDVAFAPGAYAPGTPHGDALLAHELTHVMQQRGAATDGDPTIMPGGNRAHDAAEQDADRSTGRAVQRLAGHQTDAAGPEVNTGYQLQRCEGVDGDDYAERHRSFHEGMYTWNGDAFYVQLRDEVAGGNGNAAQGSNVVFEARYAGQDEALQPHVLLSFPAIRHKPDAPQLKFDVSDGWSKLDVDLYGDGSWVGTITHRTDLIDGWTPKTRSHVFEGSAMGHAATPTQPVAVKSKDATHGAPTPVSENADPQQPSVPDVRIDLASTVAKRNLDALLADRVAAIDPAAAPWAAIKPKIDADAAQYGANAKGANAAEAARLNRFGQVLTETHPMLIGLGAASQRNGYLPDIADECIAAVTGVKHQYETAIGASWDGDASGQLQAAGKAFDQVWFTISGLYLKQGGGVEKLLDEAAENANTVRSLIPGGNPRVAAPQLKSLLGFNSGVRTGNLPTSDKIFDAKKQMEQIRADFMAGKPGVLARTNQLVQDAQVLTGLASILVLTELFRDAQTKLSGVVAKIFDKVGVNMSDVCADYVKQFDGLAVDVEAQLHRPEDLTAAGRPAVNKMTEIVNGADFKEKYKALQERGKHVATVETIGKVLAIVGVAALTGGAAGAAVGGALEGVGASAVTVAGAEFATEVLTFTAVSRLGNQAAFGGNQTSLGEDIVTNALMFGTLKAAAAAYGRVFKVFADPKVYKATYAVGGAVTGFVALQAFAEAHYAVEHNGKLMGNDERLQGLMQNAIMFAALSLGGFLGKPLNQRIRGEVLLRVAQPRLAAIEGQLAGLKAQVDGLKTDPKGPDHAAELCKRIEQLWNEELRQLGDVAKAEKDNPVEAAKEFKDTVDEYRAQIGMLDLKLAQSGLDVNLGGDRGANLFRPISPNYVAYRADGLAVLKAFYDGGNFEQVEPGIWAGKPKGGGDETFYVPEEKVPDVFKEQRPARPTEAQAEGAHSEADEARAEQVKLNQELHDVVMRNVKDGHLMVKVNRVIEGNGFAAALRANQSPTKPGPKPGKLTTIPETMGIGHGEDTFTKLAKKAPWPDRPTQGRPASDRVQRTWLGEAAERLHSEPRHVLTRIRARRRCRDDSTCVGDADPRRVGDRGSDQAHHRLETRLERATKGEDRQR